MNKIAVILSGCGASDGSEIGEVMMALLAIDLSGAQYTIFAPDKEQSKVVNHLTAEVVNETRNVLVESARIARGNIQSLDKYDASNFDALILPGGFGAAQSLSSFAQEGGNMEVDKQVVKAVESTHKAGKPIGAMCIAPVILAHILPGIKVTIGKDPQTASCIISMGGVHENKDVAQVCTDKTNKVYTTPCYMLGEMRLSQVFESAKTLISEMFS